MQANNMKDIQAWLSDVKSIEAELEGNRLTYHVSGHNDFSCRLMLLQGGRTLSWYAYTLIPVDELNDSPYRAKLDQLLLRLNDELFLGRWAVSDSGMLLFDVSIPVDEELPTEAVLSRLFDSVYESFDHQVSMIKFFLQTGRRVQRSNKHEGLKMSALQCLAERPDLYPLMVQMRLIPPEFDDVLRLVMPLPPTQKGLSSALEEETSVGNICGVH